MKWIKWQKMHFSFW